jgi:hypothetical protein
MTIDQAAGDLLGDAALPAAELSSVVSAAVGHPAAAASWHAATVAYQPGSPATGALARLRRDLTARNCVRCRGSGDCPCRGSEC